MKFSCNQDTFAKYLNILSRVVNAKPGLPILNNVLFDVSKNKVAMTATDLEISLNCWIGAEVSQDGKTTIPAKQLSEFVNSIPSEQIDVSLDESIVNIETKNNVAKFNTISPEDYPVVPTVKSSEKPILRLKKEDLLLAVHRVVFSAAHDDIKPVLTGVLIEISKENISFVATDGLRLSRQVLDLSSGLDEDLKLLVPVKALEELAKIVMDFTEDDDDEYVEIFYIKEKNQVLFRYNDIDLISRIIDGQFPEYRQIIPTGFQTSFEFKRAEFANSLKVVNIIARNISGNKIEVDIQCKKGKVGLSAVQAEIGTNKSEFEIACGGEDLKIGFSGKFLSDILNNVGEEELVFEANTDVNPGVFKIKGDENFLHLVMPMRL
jgi:DNA polymerase III subunit beta